MIFEMEMEIESRAIVASNDWYIRYCTGTHLYECIKSCTYDLERSPCPDWCERPGFESQSRWNCLVFIQSLSILGSAHDY